ncbi:hypothetical protein CHL76_09330 [Marinococcus halophilus]|uniref:Uncharacterized protein n=1 Tax=Marinococcus halophilus TaxID=1371 RepID=A0A510Y6M7_MARHA|nr:hypothetical protein [Marinococcus halophilus]OZT80298.1 hypothetical protein CHL76_09330 [Marinococcus halophilus]GEK58361.1 hypothetical protein MHA01_12660 [Marinococcus halophilus]
MLHFEKKDLHNLNHAEAPYVSIYQYGKTDISSHPSDSSRVGLSKQGMMKLVNYWIQEGNLDDNDKQQIKEWLDE